MFYIVEDKFNLSVVLFFSSFIRVHLYSVIKEKKIQRDTFPIGMIFLVQVREEVVFSSWIHT